MERHRVTVGHQERLPIIPWVLGQPLDETFVFGAELGVLDAHIDDPGTDRRRDPRGAWFEISGLRLVDCEGHLIFSFCMWSSDEAISNH
jgi:hypothetical protein